MVQSRLQKILACMCLHADKGTRAVSHAFSYTGGLPWHAGMGQRWPFTRYARMDHCWQRHAQGNQLCLALVALSLRSSPAQNLLHHGLTSPPWPKSAIGQAAGRLGNKRERQSCQREPIGDGYCRSCCTLSSALLALTSVGFPPKSMEET